MQCEVCGADITRGKRVRIGRSELYVCSNCAKYGTESDVITNRVSENQNRVLIRARKTRMRENLGFEELIDDYGKVIRREREERNWEQSELANKLNEKLSLVKKIEKEDIIPDEKLRMKLEKVLDINLTLTK